MKKVLLLSVVVLAGCAGGFETKLQSWVGQPVDSLVSNWGPPQSSFPLQSGGQVLEYARSGQMTLPGATYTRPQTTYHSGTANAYGTGGYASGTYQGTSTTYVQQQSAPTTIALRCVVRFTTDSAGTITQWSWQGNNCR